MDLQRIDRRISRALRLLEQCVDAPVDYGAVAAALGLPVHRFHHLFAEQMCESPGRISPPHPARGCRDPAALDPR